MVLAQNRHIDQWNRIERPEINLCIYGQLIYDKGGKECKDSLFISCTWKTGWLPVKGDYNVSLYYVEKRTQWFKELNIILRIIQFVEDNIGRTL